MYGRFISIKAWNGLAIGGAGIHIAPFEIPGHSLEDAHILFVKAPEDPFMKVRKARVSGVFGRTLMSQIDSYVDGIRDKN